MVSGRDGVDGVEALEGEGMRWVDGSHGVENGVREWVGAVEGGVSRVVDKLVRWMGEGDGDVGDGEVGDGGEHRVPPAAVRRAWRDRAGR